VPFVNFVSKVFKSACVLRDAPTSSGVYGLSNSRGWIYIGETDNIRARLLSHLQGNDPAMRDAQPTGFSFELCHSQNRQARQSQLIDELHPRCVSLA
jgi:excinuclease UvrABC nuclease subunit